MAKNPADRYQSAAEMLADLARIRGSLQATGAAVGDENAISLARADDRGRSESGGHDSARAVRGRSSRAVARSPRIAAGLRRPGRRWCSTGRRLPARGRRAGLELARPPACATAEPAAGGPPAWASSRAGRPIPKQDSAEEQYRYAQLRASPRRPGGRLARGPRLFPAFARVGLAGLPPARPAGSTASATSTG